MQIEAINKLTDRLIEEDWVIDFEGEDDADEKDEFADALKYMFDTAGADDGALYEFFTFATSDKGSSGASYNWDSEELSDLFHGSFRGSGRDISTVIKDYFSEFGDILLAPLIADRNTVEYFKWEEYVRDNRPDLHIHQRGSLVYLFESE